MNKALALFCSLLVVFSLSAPLSSHGGSRRGGGNRNNNAKPKEPPKPQFDAISSVDPGAATVTITHVNGTNTVPKILKITDRTEIEVNGNRGTINDLKSGMKISYTIGMDADTAARLVASPAPTN